MTKLQAAKPRIQNTAGRRRSRRYTTHCVPKRRLSPIKQIEPKWTQQRPHLADDVQVKNQKNPRQFQMHDSAALVSRDLETKEKDGTALATQGLS
jgi:hypothetical protein